MATDVVTASGECGEKGKLVGDVFTYKAGTKKADQPAEGQAALPGVKIGVKFQGDVDKGDQTTEDSGSTPVVPGLDPGDYTLTLKPTQQQSSDYDFANSTITQTKLVKANDTTDFPFSIPYHWLEYQVMYPDTTTFASGLDYVLKVKKQGDETTYEPYPSSGDGSGKTPTATAALDKVPVGTYRLDLKIVSNARWGGGEAVITQAVALKADVSGFDAGTKGSFEIYDALALAAKLDTVEASVTASETGELSLGANWTPAKDKLGDSLSGLVVFRAVLGSGGAWSAPVPVKLKEEYDVVDQAGKNINANLELRLRSGQVISAVATDGKAQVTRPWNDLVVRVLIRDHLGSRVSFVGVDGATAQLLSIRG